jgi:hypothetical protein
MNEMRWGPLLALCSMLVAPLEAAPRKSVPKPRPAPVAEAKLIQSCDAHKFETIIDTTGDDGQPHKSKVKLCGVEGQSDAEWIGTLRDAVRKLAADKEMPAARRDQIVAAINAEIGRLSIVGVSVPAKRKAEEQSSLPLSRDYATLPPLPQGPETPAAAAPIAAPATPVTEPAARAVATPAPPAFAAAGAIAAVPKLAFLCYTPGELAADAPCGEFERETLLTVHAGGTVPAGAVLRFVRNGAPRGDVDLAPLASAGSMRVALPRNVCAGFGAGRLQLQVLVNGSEAQSAGPYPLRC